MLLEIVDDYSSPGLYNFIKIIKNILDILQIILPILLIISLVYLFIKLMSTMDEKKYKKRIVNSLIALFIAFFMPLFINVLFSLIGESYTISSYWNSLSSDNNSNVTYIETDSGTKKSIISSPSDYEKGEERTESTSTTSTTTTTTNSTISKQAFLTSLKRMSDYVRNDKHTWYYNYPGTSKTFDKAVSNNNLHLTCVVLANWGLRDIGVLQENQMAYQSPGQNYKLVFTHGAKASIEKYATIYHFSSPKTLAQIKSSIGLEPGDIIFWSGNHTNIYAGTNSKGKMTFYDAGRCTDGQYKGSRYIFNSFGPVQKSYPTKKVKDLIRINN